MVEDRRRGCEWWADVEDEVLINKLATLYKCTGPSKNEELVKTPGCIVWSEAH